MPRTVQPSSSTRKSARHSGDASASSGKSKVDRSRMAFNLLHDQVLEGSFKAIKDPKNVMSFVWVREGKDMEEDEEGVDWIRQDGFTVAKYQQFWDLEMADEEEAIVEWAPKLPSVAKTHVSEEALLERWPQGHDGEEEEEEEDEEVVEVAKVSPNNKRKAKKSAKQPAKKRKTAKAVAGDGLQDTPLLKRRDEWFALLNAGGNQFFTLEKAKKSDGIHKMKERADRATEAFSLNSGKVEGAKEFHKDRLDALKKRIEREFEAQLAKEAMVRRKQFFEAFRMVGYVSASDVAAPEADGGNASEGEATKKDDATTDEEGAADEDKETLSDVAADDLVEDVLA